MGQSFGGFCAIHYLSFYPDSLEKVFISIPHEEIEEKEELIFKDSLKGLLKESSKFKNYNIKKGYKNLNSIKKIKKDSLNLSI